MKCSSPKGEAFEVGLDQMDRYFGLSPRDAEELLRYVTELEKKAGL
jgi:hypothetical protein